MGESFELSNFTQFQKQGSILTKCPPMQKLSLAQRRRRITLTSLHYRGRYALRVTPLSPPGRAFKLFAASAERKRIFKVEKSLNPEVLGCFSRFWNFSNFSWFWGGLTLNFDFLALFPARGCFQITLALNFMPIQIFLFMYVFIWQFCLMKISVSVLRLELSLCMRKCLSISFIFRLWTIGFWDNEKWWIKIFS